MKQILTKIFTANAFQDVRDNEAISFFKKSANTVPQEFFIVQKITKSEFAQTDDLFEQGLQIYEEMKSSTPSIAKNTSFILAVEADDLSSDLLALKNKILKVEEDTFWFKKYVIVYNQSSIATLNSIEDVLVELKTILLDNSRFQSFKNNIFSDEVYLVTVQIFLKLPFLGIPVDSADELLSISAILNNVLSARQANLLQKLNEIGNIQTSLNWSEVKELALRQDTSDVIIDEFLTKFADNAQA